MLRRKAVFRDVPSHDSIASVVDGYWREIVQAFQEKGYDEPKRVRRIRIDPSWHDTCRHFAGARTDGSVMVVAPEIWDLPEQSIRAILAHEGGHFVDFGSPGRFWFRAPAAVRVRQGAVVRALHLPTMYPTRILAYFEQLPGKLGRHLREWRERDDDEVELVADAIASYVLQQEIAYTGPRQCLIQTLGRGVERPLGLR